MTTQTITWLLAVSALGWGLSLFLYRWYAEVQGLPMGAMQEEQPVVTRGIGLVAVVVALLFDLVVFSFDPPRGLGLLLIGIAFGLLWTLLLRVYSQVSLFLAPLAALILAIMWIA